MKLVPSQGMRRKKPGSVEYGQYTRVQTINIRLIGSLTKLAWGSTRVTQKWAPHAVSSCVCVDPEEVEGRDCFGLPFGLPFICTSGVLAMLAG